MLTGEQKNAARIFDDHDAIFLVFFAVETIKNLTTEENQSQIPQIPFLTFYECKKIFLKFINKKFDKKKMIWLKYL